MFHLHGPKVPVWQRHLLDRLGEPLHLNAVAMFIKLFGSFRAKVDFDLVIQRPHAFGILHAADVAAAFDVKEIVVLEFGVAAGRGLMNMARLASEVSTLTGVTIEVIGFDTGQGLPPPADHRDHPELYRTGDYPPVDKEQLLRSLPGNAQLIYGDIADTVDNFIINMRSVIGYVSIDVDYYSSAISCLHAFSDPDPCKYLPLTTVYIDDMNLEPHNPYAGELLAIAEFNEQQSMRKITPFHNLRRQRIFKRPGWIDQIYTLHVHDHPRRTVATAREREVLVVDNPYLRAGATRDRSPAEGLE